MKIVIRRMPIAVVVLLLLLSACKNSPTVSTTLSLPRSVPEAEGVSSQDIITFLDSAATSQHEFHSIMILRHGKVVAEGWWDPYKPNLRHTLYSTSKSFTSTAVGFAVSEKRLALNDKVISFFPDDLPDTVSPFLADMTVKDLLTMSVGQDPDPTFSVRTNNSNWAKAFLALPIVNKPGTKFLYNSMATYMLSAIVQKVTGEKLIDYLTPRLFEPLGIQGMDWEVDPKGINTGGWGLRIKTEDMAKFGQFYLQKGMWNGKQLIPVAWIEEATTFKIDQAPGVSQARRDSSDWMQGYCYQFWRCRNNFYRADGAYGQYIIVMSDKDAVIAITSESQSMPDELNMVWKYLLPAFKNEKLPENSASAANLKQRLSSLALPLPPKGTDSPVVTRISDKTYKLEPNDWHIKTLGFHFMEDMCHVTLKTDSTNYTLTYGAGRWITDETNLPGPSLTGSAKGLLPAKVAGSYSWKDENTLELVLRYIESPHRETLTCRFDKNAVLVDIKISNTPGVVHPTIKGKL
jgi:CubicO group peptidase (beta-lactamase class C family)